MDAYRLFERQCPWLAFVTAGGGVCIGYWCVPVSVEVVVPVLTATVSVSAIAVGFIGTVLGMLYSMSQGRVVRHLRDTKGKRWQELVNYAVSAIVWAFLVTVASWIGLFIELSSQSIVNCALVALWSALVAGGAVSVGRITMVFAFVLKLEAGDGAESE